MSQSYTRITDIVVPEVFNPYFIERTAEKSELIKSGIVKPDVLLDQLASAGGKTINMPFFTDLSGNSEVLAAGSAASSLSVNKISTATDVAVLFMRGKAWGANDLAKAVSGADPMGAVAELVADWWARDEQATLINILKGVFSDNVDNDSSDLISNVSRGAGNSADDSNLANSDTITDAQFKLGDSAKKLTAMMMHSVIYQSLVKQKVIDFVFDESVSMNIPYYMDKRIIVDDTCPSGSAATNGSYYDTYLFGEGAVGRGEGQAPVPTEMDRDSLAGDDILITRRHFLLHPRGIAWQSADTNNDSPTNAEATMASNWDRVYEKKNIRIVKMRTNG